MVQQTEATVKSIATQIHENRPYIHLEQLQQAADLVLAGQVWESSRGYEVVDGGRQYVAHVDTGKCSCHARCVCVHLVAGYLIRGY